MLPSAKWKAALKEDDLKLYETEKYFSNFLKHKGSIDEGDFNSNDTLCRQVSNREPHMQRFAKEHDVIIFVSGRKSSNGKALFTVCEQYNTNSHFISSPEELEEKWFAGSGIPLKSDAPCCDWRS